MDYAFLRKRMVEEQLIPREIHNKRVLDAFYKIERHTFVSEISHSGAYGDFPLSIGEGQTISQPYIVALMTQCLELTGKERVLEIGTGSGYQAAILAELAEQVFSIERIDSLAKKAEAAIRGSGYTNVRVKVGDGTLGWPEFSPFDRIIITAASPRVPLPLIEQLAEGGKLILPMGDSFSQVLTLVEKKEGRLESRQICGCVFVPLIGKFAYRDTQ